MTPKHFQDEQLSRLTHKFIDEYTTIALFFVTDPKTFVFKSDDFESNPNLCVIIHGSGVVRAGQWARRLIMNETLDLGTIMPEVMMVKEKGFAVLVMNTNDNTR